MKAALEAVWNGSVDMSPITRVAARAALFVHEKYAKIMEESEMYCISIGKCHRFSILDAYLRVICQPCVRHSSSNGSLITDILRMRLKKSVPRWSIDSAPRTVILFSQRTGHSTLKNWDRLTTQEQ